MKHLTQKEMAKALGISQPAVAQLVKRGMPMDSAENASAWRRNNTRPRGGSKPHPTTLEGVEAPPVLSEDDPEELGQAKMLCQSTFTKAMEAINQDQGASAISQLVAAYQKAVQAKDNVERILVARSREAGELMHIDDVRAAVSEKVGQLRTQLDALPTAICQDGNPADPDHCRAAAERGLEQVLVTLSDVENHFASLDSAKA